MTADAEGRAGRAEAVDTGQDPAGHEHGRDGAGAAGDCAGGVADAAGDVRPRSWRAEVRIRNRRTKWQQLHQRMWQMRS